MFKALLCSALIVVPLTSCGRQGQEREYAQALADAEKVVPYLPHIRKVFPSVSFISNYENPVGQAEWHTRFYIDGWYEVVLAQHVKFSKGKMEVVGDAVLYLYDIKSIALNAAGGVKRKSYGKNVILKGKEIEVFIESGFDLASVGFVLKKRRKPPPVDLLAYWRCLHPDGYHAARIKGREQNE